MYHFLTSLLFNLILYETKKQNGIAKDKETIEYPAYLKVGKFKNHINKTTRISKYNNLKSLYLYEISDFYSKKFLKIIMNNNPMKIINNQKSLTL